MDEFDLAAIPQEKQKKQRAVRPSRADPMSDSAFQVGGRDITPVPYRSKYNIDSTLVEMMTEEPFFSAISLRVQKVMTRSVSTMGVAYFDSSFHMLVNPDFVQKLQDAGRKAEIISVIAHEFYHVMLGHLTIGSRFTSEMKQKLLNWAMDASINSMLHHEQKRQLPSCPIIPGLRPGMPLDIAKDPIVNPKHVAAMAEPPTPLERAVMDAKPMMHVEYYYNLFLPHWTDQDEAAGGPQFSGDGDGTPGTDDHDMWVEAGCDPEMVAEDVRRILEAAIKAADAKGWGSIPVSGQTMLRAMLKPEIDWREQFRDWCGTQYQANERVHTHRKVNKRYPYQMPGSKRGRGLRAALFLDQSGSVDNESLSMLCDEIGGMSDVAAVTVIPFDSHIDTENILDLEQGDVPWINRTRCGGTNFQVAVDWIGHEDNRQRFDVMWMLTDGECGKPDVACVPRCWVITPGRKLLFETDEKVIYLKSDR